MKQHYLMAALLAASLSFPAVAEAAATVPELITNPQGVKKNYLESGNGWYLFLGMFPADDPFNDAVTNIVYGDDNKVYIYDIVPRFHTEAYVEGVLENNQIKVTFPQAVKVEKRDGEIYDYYADRLDRELVGEDAFGTKEYNYWPSETREVIYNINEDGTIEMEKSKGEWAVGITNRDGLWQGVCDWNCVYTPNAYELVTAPEGLETEEMQFIANYTGHNVNVGFDGDDVYLQGVCALSPEIWIVGKRDGNKVTFENAQYLGDIPGFNMMGFFFGGYAYPDEKYVWAYDFAPNLVMEYDEATKTFSTDQTIIINSNDTNLKYMMVYRTPLIHPGVENPSPEPQNPAPISFSPFEASGNCIGFKFYLPNLSVDNYLLNKDELFWSLYIDDELYTFEPYLFEGLRQDMTEIPYNFDLTDDIENKGDIPMHTIYIPIEDFTKVGYVNIHYVPGEADPYYSDIVEFLNPDKSAVELLPLDSESPERYFDLNGLPVDKPVKGHIYIVDKGTKTIKRLF